jgi:alpha-L-fucosidase 2
VLFGHSAGGHLVCLAGLVAGEDTRVQGVVGCAPVADLVQDSVRRGGLSTSLQALFGLPIFHLTAASPPVLLVQGLADQTVPYPGTRIFQDRLQAAGIPCQLIGIPGAPHSMMTWEKLDPGYPARLDAWLAATVGR